MSFRPLPDTEAIVAAFLRSRAEVADLIGDRVYTVFPAQAGAGAFLLVQRIGGQPVFNRPLWLDQAALQLDAYGGAKKTAYDVLAASWTALEALPGTYDDGVITGVEFGPVRWQPDPAYPQPRPRYVADVAVFSHPAVVPAGRSRSTVVPADLSP